MSSGPNYDHCKRGCDYVREAPKSRHLCSSRWAGDHFTVASTSHVRDRPLKAFTTGAPSASVSS